MIEDTTKMPLTSENIVEDRISVLKELIPEAFAEGKIDFGKLKKALGDFTDDSLERYGLSWAGKSDATRAVQSLSAGTLVPCKEESVNFDTTENLIIEGDNLEVLKLLQKSYYGKVKMIYIDPPYNTGKEFVYPDNFREGLEDYLKYSGQVSDEGFQVETNTERSGRFHSKWLDMIYPRIFLAKNLLRDDGVIFVSINDSEVHNLRCLMNEIFGEENFLSVIVVQSNKRGQTYKQVSQTHEYILVYTNSSGSEIGELMKSGGALPFTDSKGSYDLWELRNRNPKFGRHNRPNLYYPIYVASTLFDESGYNRIALTPSEEYPLEVYPKNKEGKVGCWRWSKEKVQAADLDSDTPTVVAKSKRDGSFNIYEKSRKETTKVKSLWTETEVISEQGTVQLGQLGLPGFFDHPKPSALIVKCLTMAADDEESLVLDFFAGSGTTAQAVWERNAEDGGRRKFILVQLPEPTPPGSEARKAGFTTIAELCKERVRRTARMLDEKSAGMLEFSGENEQDHGVKVFRLTSSNFKLWNADEAPNDAEDLVDQLRMFADHIVTGCSQDDILYELLLKAGLPLSAKVEQIEIERQQVFSVAEGLLLICLEDPIEQKTLRGMIDLAPQMVLCLDHAFNGNDQLKTNIVLEMQSHEIKFQTV